MQDVLKIEGINSKGFGIIPKIVMQDTELSLIAKTIYAYFCSLAGNGTTAFPKRDTILHILNISKDYYYKNFKQLIDQGFIKVERANTFPYNNTYILVSNPKKYDEKDPRPKYNKNRGYIKYSGLKAFGFGIIPRAIFFDARLDAKAKGIYAYFCSLAGNGTTAFPERDLILHHLNIAPNTYYKYFDQLIQYNYISVVQRKSENGRFYINDYYINEYPNTSVVQNNLPCINLQDNDESSLNTDISPCINLQDNGKSSLNTDFSPCINLPDNTPPDNTGQDNYTINNITKNNITKNISINQASDRLIDNNSEIDNYKMYRGIISKNIEYEHLKKYIYKGDTLLDDILELMVETVCTKKRKIRVCGEDKPASIVKSVLLKLNRGHIEYVIDSMKNNTTKVNNIEAYLLTALYKSHITINAYYANLVQHNLYGD